MRRHVRRIFPRRIGSLMNEQVKIIGLWKRYGDLDVLKGIDLSVARGERVALIGPSGAGKTVLAHLLAGL